MFFVCADKVDSKASGPDKKILLVHEPQHAYRRPLCVNAWGFDQIEEESSVHEQGHRSDDCMNRVTDQMIASHDLSTHCSDAQGSQKKYFQ